MREKIVVIITNFSAEGTHSYTAADRESCKDEIDRIVFDLVIEHGEDIKMGQVWGCIK
tara:strand:- start:84 stop:257 length:174 start_codon:yes stop_codon:yes gene_type:complete